MSSQVRCVCGCGGAGSRRLGAPRMSLQSLARKLKACVVPHDKRYVFLRLYEEAEDNLERKQILLNNRRMAPEHKVGKHWGPVSISDAGILRPAPSPLRATPQGVFRFSSPVPITPSAALLRAREALYGPEYVRCFQNPSNGAYRKGVTDSQKKAIREARKAFDDVAAQNAQQAAYTRALEEALVRVSEAQEAPAWVALPRVPGAFSPGLSWERLRTSPAHIVATLTGFPSYDFVARVYEYLNCHGGLSEGAMYSGVALREAPPELPPIPEGGGANYWETHFIPKAAAAGASLKPRALQGINDFFHFLYICRGHTHAEAGFHFAISEASSSNHFIHMATRLHSAVDKYMPLTPACRAAFLCPPALARNYGRVPSYAADAMSTHVGAAQNSATHRSMFSDYKGTEVVKTEGACSALGNVEHVSVGYAGNVTDDFMLTSGPLAQLLPPGSNVFIDRGYTLSKADLQAHGHNVFIPSMREKVRTGAGKGSAVPQYTVEQGLESATAAGSRTVIERVWARMDAKWPWVRGPFQQRQLDVLESFKYVLLHFQNYFTPLTRESALLQATKDSYEHIALAPASQSQ